MRNIAAAVVVAIALLTLAQTAATPALACTTTSYQLGGTTYYRFSGYDCSGSGSSYSLGGTSYSSGTLNGSTYRGSSYGFGGSTYTTGSLSDPYGGYSTYRGSTYGLGGSTYGSWSWSP